MTFGRPKSVEFLTLIERRFTQHLPIRADYIGQSIDTINEEKSKCTMERGARQGPNITLFP